MDLAWLTRSRIRVRVKIAICEAIFCSLSIVKQKSDLFRLGFLRRRKGVIAFEGDNSNFNIHKLFPILNSSLN